MRCRQAKEGEGRAEQSEVTARPQTVQSGTKHPRPERDGREVPERDRQKQSKEGLAQGIKRQPRQSACSNLRHIPPAADRGPCQVQK